MIHMKRAIHNFFHMFASDRGAHFTYNIGVWFVRTGAVLFFVAAAYFAAFLMGEEHWSKWAGALLLSFALYATGISQERLGMKYPRSDVDIEEHALAVPDSRDTDRLMQEFDAAYEKVMHNREM